MEKETEILVCLYCAASFKRPKLKEGERGGRSYRLCDCCYRMGM